MKPSFKQLRARLLHPQVKKLLNLYNKLYSYDRRTIHRIWQRNALQLLTSGKASGANVSNRRDSRETDRLEVLAQAEHIRTKEGQTGGGLKTTKTTFLESPVTDSLQAAFLREHNR